MERVETLCKRLLEQLSQNASADTLLMTVQMLQSELLHLKATTKPDEVSSRVAIDMPVSFENDGRRTAAENSRPEKTVEILQIDEAEVEAELEEIKKMPRPKTA